MHSFGHTSPARDVIEDKLVQVFGRLDLQLVAYVDNWPIIIHQEQKDTASMVFQTMPYRFVSIEETRIYLDIVIRRLKHFLYSPNNFLIGQFIPDKDVFDDDSLHWVYAGHASFLLELSK